MDTLSTMVKALLVSLLLSVSAQAATADKQEYEVHKVNDQVYVISKIWGEHSKINMGVVIGDEGILLISSMMKSNAPKLEAEIRKLSDKPIKYVVNLAADNFHHHANEYFASRGATIISHQELRYTGAYTQLTFDDTLSLPLGNETLTAYYTPAHDLGQLVVHLEDSNLVFMGDAFRNDWLMFLGQHGIDGQLAGLDLALSLADDNTRIVPGNRDSQVFSDKKTLHKARQTMLTFARHVGKLHREGMSVADIARADATHALVNTMEGYEQSKGYLEEWIAEIIETEYTPAFPLTPAQLQRYVGTYELTPDSQIEVVVKDNKLYAREKGKFSIELLPLSTTRFDFKSWLQDDHLEFTLAPSGEIEGMLPVLSKGSWNHNHIKPGKRLKL